MQLTPSGCRFIVHGTPEGPTCRAISLIWEIQAWVYVDKAAPPEVKDAFRLAGLRAFGPAGTFEQDDMDNWQECTQTCRGVVARRYDLNLQMGLGHERFNEDLGAWASDFHYSESNQRRFYRRWGQLMAANSWANL